MPSGITVWMRKAEARFVKDALAYQLDALNAEHQRRYSRVIRRIEMCERRAEREQRARRRP